jgi:hypothetical protein
MGERQSLHIEQAKIGGVMRETLSRPVYLLVILDENVICMLSQMTNLKRS